MRPATKITFFTHVILALLLSACQVPIIAYNVPLVFTQSTTTPRFRGVGYERAERVGFEPTVDLSPQRFSRPPQSATLAPLQ